MSDTPRTDAVVEKHIGPRFDFRANAVELHDHAKQLERELAAEKQRSERLEKALREFVEANEKGSSMEWVHRMARCHKIAKDALGDSNA